MSMIARTYGLRLRDGSRRKGNHAQLEIQGSAGITGEVEARSGGEMNVRLLRRIAKVIQEKPKEFDLNNWHYNQESGGASGGLGKIAESQRVSCKTTHCIAGWAQVLSPKRDLRAWAYPDARRLLGLDGAQAERLFYANCWPRGFGGFEATASQAAARIEHFIKTKGAE